MHTKSVPFEFKSLDDAGTFEATVAVFGNVDKIGDRIMPGAFAKSLAQWEASGDPLPVIFNHDWASPHAHIGVVEKAMETQQGLLVKGRLDIVDNDVARQVHRLMQRRSLKEFSFGYSIPKGGEKKAKDGANELLEIDLAEVGPTLKGMNPATELHAVKSALGVEDPPPDAETLRKEADRVAREEAEARFPPVPPAPKPEQPDLAKELQDVKTQLAETQAAIEDLRKKAEETSKEPSARSVDPLRKQADAVALEFASDGQNLRKPPIPPVLPKPEPELALGDLKRRMREEILVHLSGGTSQ